MSNRFYFDMNITPKKDFTSYSPMYDYDDFNPQKFSSTVVIDEVDYVVNSQLIYIKNGGQFSIPTLNLESFYNDIIKVVKSIDGLLVFKQAIESPPLIILDKARSVRKSSPYLSFDNTHLIDFYTKPDDHINVAKIFVQVLDIETDIYEIGKTYLEEFSELKDNLIRKFI